MDIKEHVSLKGYTTFGIDVSAKYFLEVRSLDDLQQAFSQKLLGSHPHMVLGGGSNVLFTKDFVGLAIMVCNKGIEVAEQTAGSIVLEVQAGEEWDGLVAHCVERGWGGLENLSGIPGRVGASPMQNIGAYGRELKDVFHSLQAFDKQTGRLVKFGPKDCQFGYRDSHFKNEGKNRYIITSVCFRLSLKNHHLHIAYGSLLSELDKLGIKDPGIRDVRQAVINIRNGKLPDPSVLGNAGSFFKNPVVSMEKFLRLQDKHPDLVAFPDPGGMKLAAGWLIEKAGLKGFRKGDAGVHERQALVLVNYGRARGQDIADLGQAVQNAVSEKFGVELAPEVNIY